MDRVAEPELMSDRHQVQAYASADFAEAHSQFVTLLAQRLVDLPSTGRALDLGCGPGDITRRFAINFPAWQVDAVDGSAAMLEVGQQLNITAGLDARIQFHELILPVDSLPLANYALIFSNSLLHHLRDPAVLWSTIRDWGSSGTNVFVMDLLRPRSRSAARALVDRYAANEPAVLRTDFYNSLLAAYRPPEVRSQLESAHLEYLHLQVTSDRHFIVWGGLH